MFKKPFRKIMSVFLAMAVILPIVAVQSFAAPKLSKSSLVLTKGYQTTITMTGTGSAVKWESSNTSIATVSGGKIVGRGVGTAKIYATVGSQRHTCSVQVVAGKINTSVSSVTLDKGQNRVVTVTAIGSHGLSIGTTDKKVATATWIRPLKWDGDKINFSITAVNPGTARIKIYLTSYPSSVFKFVDVTVKSPSSPASDNVIILPEKTSVSVGTGATTSLTVGVSDRNAVNYIVQSSAIAAVTVGSVSGNYVSLNIKGVNAGNTVLRISSKTNSKNYKDVNITVGGGAEYYKVLTVQPQKSLSTDQVISFTLSNGGRRYMLVPANYDTALANTYIAQHESNFSHYTVYTIQPGRKASGDIVKTFTAVVDNQTVYRYVLVPSRYDEIKYNSVIAEYTKIFEYYTIYTVSPKKFDNWDVIKTWSVHDSFGNRVIRYMLVPSNYDAWMVDQIMEDDISANETYSFYKAYDRYPTVTNAGDIVITWNSGSRNKYMVVPANTWKTHITYNDNHINQGLEGGGAPRLTNTIYSLGETRIQDKTSTDPYRTFTISVYGNSTPSIGYMTVKKDDLTDAKVENYIARSVQGQTTNGEAIVIPNN